MSVEPEQRNSAKLIFQPFLWIKIFAKTTKGFKNKCHISPLDNPLNNKLLIINNLTTSIPSWLHIKKMLVSFVKKTESVKCNLITLHTL